MTSIPWSSFHIIYKGVTLLTCDMVTDTKYVVEYDEEEEDIKDKVS